LGWAAVNQALDVPLDEYFDEYEDGVPYLDDEPTLMAQVNKEFHQTGKMSWGQIPADWRHGRELYNLRLPPDGWFIDIGSADTVSAIATAIPKRLASAGITTLTLGDLYGDNRVVTTLIAHWLRGRALFDGSLPHGIFYRSKFGLDFGCFAIWLRAVDDGKELTSEPTAQIGSREILRMDPDLKRAAALLGLNVH